MNWETRLNLAAHPLAYPFVRALGRRPVVKVPGLGVVVSDAVLARRVLMDGETFRKDGPGSSGDLWTPILGPSVLLNMEGEAHRALRRRLQELFTPDYTARLCVRVLGEPLRDLVRRLPDGVDLVDEMRVLAGTVIGEVIGLSGGTPDDYRHLFEAGERIVGMVTLRTRTLSGRQRAVAQSVLGPIGETAAAAYRAGDEGTVLGRMRGLGLSEAEARGAAAAFFLTGTETVATLVPRLIALLADHGRIADVAADPRLLDPAIDEAMRATVPTPVMLRSVHASASIGDVRVRPGDRVLIATINCCRAYGPFDLDRPQPPELKRLWFGAGPHFCIGFPLAHAEIRAVAGHLLNVPGLRVVERSAARGVLIPTYRRLVVQA